MTTKKSAFTSCIGAAFDRTRLAFVLMCVYSFVCLVLGVLMSLSLTNSSFMTLNTTLSDIYSLLGSTELIALGIGLIISIWLFSKYTNYVSNNLIKSLPALGRDLFWADFIVGAAIVLLPALISLVLQTVIGGMIEGSNTDVAFTPLGVSYGFIFNYLFSYCVGVLCFSISGGTLQAVILFAVLNFIPSIVSSFVAFARSCILGLFPMDELANTLKLSTTYSIVMDMFSNDNGSFSYLQLAFAALAILAICTVITVVAFVSFSKLRASDRSSVKFKNAMSAVSVCAISFYCGFLVLFFKRAAVTFMNAIIIIPSMLMAAFVIYYIANTLTLHSLHIEVKRLAPFSAVFVLLFAVGLVYFTNGFNRALYVPEVSDIESVTINYADDNYHWQVNNQYYQRYTFGHLLADTDVEVQFPIKYTEYKDKVCVTKFHKRLLETYKEHGYIETTVSGDGNFEGNESGRVELIYKLKNGKTVKRYYNYTGESKHQYNLQNLSAFDTSVTVKQSRVIEYINSEPVAGRTFKLYIAAIPDDLDYITFDLSDEQMQGLVDAIYKDEQNVSENDVLSNADGDLATIMISYEDEYFEGIFNPYYNKNRMVLKTCFTNTIEYLKNELDYDASSYGMTTSEIKQIFIGDYNTVNRTNRWINYNDIYSFDYESIYNYDYYNCERVYNTDALNNEQIASSDGYICDANAVEYLSQNLKLMTTSDLSGKLVIINNIIDTPFNAYSDSYFSEYHMASSKQVYYISNEVYTTFIGMCSNTKTTD